MRNLPEVAPTMYFNVPRGFDLLLPFLEKDAALRAQLLPRPRRAVLRRRRAAAEPLGSPAEALSKLEKTATGDALGLGLDRDLAARHLGALPDGARRASSACRWRAASSSWCPPPASSRCGCAARTSRPATTSAPDLTAGRVRRGRLLPHRRRGEARRSRRPGARASSSTAASPRTSSSPPAPGCTSARCASS